MSTSYKNLIVYAPVTISAGQTTSTILNCITTSEGAACPRRINFPANWTPADVFFLLSETADFAVSKEINISQNNLTNIYSIPSCPANCTIPLTPWIFDSVAYLKIVSSTPQVQTVTVDFILQPIYQGVA